MDQHGRGMRFHMHATRTPHLVCLGPLPLHAQTQRATRPGDH
jgi:hypothetical protein